MTTLIGLTARLGRSMRLTSQSATDVLVDGGLKTATLEAGQQPSTPTVGKTKPSNSGP
jgi:hypothetical protein